MYKHLLPLFLAVVLMSCAKNDQLEQVQKQTTATQPILKVSSGQSYHTCELETGLNGHICMYPGRNCRNTGRKCEDIDMNGNPNNPDFYSIISASLMGQDEFEMFWNFTYDAGFVQQHYDMFIKLNEYYEGIHPDEQIEYLNSL